MGVLSRCKFCWRYTKYTGTVRDARAGMDTVYAKSKSGGRRPTGLLVLIRILNIRIEKISNEFRKMNIYFTFLNQYSKQTALNLCVVTFIHLITYHVAALPPSSKWLSPTSINDCRVGHRYVYYFVPATAVVHPRNEPPETTVCPPCCRS